MNQALDWNKSGGLIPAIIQDNISGIVLMLGYMNEEALAQTLATKQVTFFSRSRQKIWVKGETSGNFLKFVSMAVDCDGDAILIMAKPMGPTCHTRRAKLFFPDDVRPELSFLQKLEAVISSRLDQENSDSYVAQLVKKGSA